MIPIIICKFSSFDLDAAVQQGLISRATLRHMLWRKNVCK